MIDLTFWQWALVLLCGFIFGFSKTGLPGIGILAIPIMAAVLPPRASVGVVLPILIMGDVFAVAFYRRHAVWSHVLRLMPWAFVGIVLGYLWMGRIDDRQLRPMIGGIVLAMLILNYWRSRSAAAEHTPSQWWFAALVGLLAGLTTMMANAAGPILMIYLLAMGLPKNEFLGTGAWYFLILNWVKVPFSIHLGLIDRHSLLINLAAAPLVIIGALAGVYALKRIPQKAFGAIVQLLAALAALHLLLSKLW
jgi:uncharacterized membrane protein YfcA